MEYKIFNSIKILEDKPRIYFHISGSFIFNELAIKNYALDKADRILFTDSVGKVIIGSIKVLRIKNSINFKGTFQSFFGAISEGKINAYFSFELHGSKSGFSRVKKGKIDILLTMLNRQVEGIDYEQKKTTLKDQVESRRKIIDLVKSIFKFNDEKYNSLIFENAFGYFEKRGFDSTLTEFLKKSDKFWTWWKNEYYNIEIVILQKYDDYLKQNPKLKGKLPSDELIDWYNDVHQGLEIIPDMYIFQELKSNSKAIQTIQSK